MFGHSYILLSFSSTDENDSETVTRDERAMKALKDKLKELEAGMPWVL